MPSNGAISQLVLQVDAQVAVAQRDLQNLARAVNQSSGQMNTALDSTARAHERLNGAFNNSRLAQLELTHVVTASVDAYAAGSSPIRILTLEMGRLAEAATFLGGSGGAGVLGKLASFMGGPFGIAILLGVNVLTQFIAKHQDTGQSVDELVEKLRKEATQSELSRKATAAFLQTYEGAADNINKVVDALDKENRTLEQNTALQQNALRGNIDTLQKQRLQVMQDLDAAQKQLSSAISGYAASRGPSAALNPDAANVRQYGPQAIAQAQSKIASLAAQINSIDDAIAKAQRGIVESALPLFEKQAQAAVDPLAAIQQHYEELRKYAEQAAAGNKDSLAKIEKAFSALGQKMPSELGGVLIALDKLEEKEKKAAEAAMRSAKAQGEFGKQLSFTQAAAIASGAGLKVTSGYRSAAEQARLYNDPAYNHPGNPVARPGTSAHNGFDGKWALDIAFAPGLTAQSLKKLYGEQGVTLSAVYKEDGHFHIEGRRPTEDVQAEKEAARAEEERKKALDDLLSKQMDLSDELKKQPSLIDSSGEAEAYLKQGIDSVEQAVTKLNDKFRSRQEELMRFADEFAGAIANVVTGTESLKQAFSDLARSIVGEIIQMTVKMLIFRALTSAFPGFFGSPQVGGQFNSPFANGGVFVGGNVVPFATGGVVSSPFLFPMANGATGLMGEAGPEAVLPLARDSSGRLGVRASMPRFAIPQAANNNSSRPVIVELSLKDDMLDARIVQGAGQVVVAAAPTLIKKARATTVRSLTRPSITGH